MKTPAQENLDRVLAASLVPILRADGFRKSGRTFRRGSSEAIQVVNVQVSQWSSAGVLRVTLNYGVFHPRLHALSPAGGGTPGPAGPHEYQCQLRTRIGSLLPDGRDLWWELESDADPGPLAATVRDLHERFGRPWLERMANPATAREHARGVDAVLLAHVTGDHAQAYRLFRALVHASPDPQALEAWGAKVGLNRPGGP